MGLLWTLILACEQSTSKNLELTQQVHLDKLGLTIKLPTGWDHCFEVGADVNVLHQ